MSLFAKKCLYCKAKIKKGEEVTKDVKVPGYLGTSKKNFCCENHANEYCQEVEKHLSKSKKSRGGCCG